MTKLMIAALAATTALATPAFANSQDTTVWATIAPVCTIEAPANNGSIALGGTTDLGNVKVTCNDPQGFTANVSSGNHGKLSDSSGGGSTTSYPYTLTVGPAAGVSLATAQGINSHTYGLDDIALTGYQLPVHIVIGTPSGPAFAGTYSDVITWTVDAN